MITRRTFSSSAALAYKRKGLPKDKKKKKGLVIPKTYPPREGDFLKVAIGGDVNGDIDTIYARATTWEKRNKQKIDVLLLCGDVQTVRNEQDMQTIVTPPKFYRRLNDFQKYYTGKEPAPIPTILIGGDHDTYNYFWQLYHGGWVAPNMYYMGFAGCVQVNGVRIAGVSGIHDKTHYRRGFFERIPWNGEQEFLSICATREFNIRKLSLLSTPNIFMSHEWPYGALTAGDVEDVMMRKKDMRKNIHVVNRVLGSKPLQSLMRTLQPPLWFSGHMQARYTAQIPHPYPKSSEIWTEEGPEVLLPAQQPSEEPAPEVPTTNFLALDRAIQGLAPGQYMEVIDVPIPPEQAEVLRSGAPAVLSFDPEWLAITRAFQPYMSLELKAAKIPDEATMRAAVQRELAWVQEHVMAGRDVLPLEEVQQCDTTAPPPGFKKIRKKPPVKYWPNAQTAAYCKMLQIENNIDSVMQETQPQNTRKKPKHSHILSSVLAEADELAKKAAAQEAGSAKPKEPIIDVATLGVMSTVEAATASA
ncbi:hypothetical protein CERSUDRAFT_97491 [Gelatoporia subvermispora B]|uniref:Lariat debranching enzyme C-terminal domain-containing protein n=1 Tax=Ceriporiopsis subvermispora (strain B) TaxID=914234 RepID=M2R757_CERS8|nr:hypothetical protein CERSUDRAFT_97491 [Gelatoporia subvermispora B]